MKIFSDSRPDPGREAVREMLRLITYFGTIVYLDEATLRLRHGPIGNVPDNVTAADDRGTLSLLHRPCPGDPPAPVGDLGSDGCQYLPHDPSPNVLHLSWKTPDTFVLQRNGRFLTAEADGSISLFRTRVGSWEEFLPISEEDYRELRFLTDNSWIQRVPRVILRPSDISPETEFSLRFGQAVLPIRKLLEVIRAPGGARPSVSLELLARYEHWKVVHLRLYRPLVYLVGYGKDEIFACASLAIQSLLLHGRWCGDIMFLTDRGHADFTAGSDLKPDKLHVVILPSDDILDFALARYQISQVEIAQQYQPIIYMDTDVICNAPLDSLLDVLCFSDLLHALPEGDLLGPEDHYGKTLFDRHAGLANETDKGFSSGILAFRNASHLRRAFDLIIAGAYAFASEELRRDFFPAYDQPFANYVLRTALGEIGSLEPWARCTLYIFEPDYGPESRLGLIHFAGGVGNAAPKIDRMRSYLGAIAEGGGHSDAMASQA